MASATPIRRNLPGLILYGSLRESRAADQALGSGGANVASTAYLNKAAFVDPAIYTEGNIPRSAVFGLFAPHNADLDLSVQREFPIHERLRLVFQADAFNVNKRGPFRGSGNRDRFRHLRYFLINGEPATQASVQR